MEELLELIAEVFFWIFVAPLDWASGGDRREKRKNKNER